MQRRLRAAFVVQAASTEVSSRIADQKGAYIFHLAAFPVMSCSQLFVMDWTHGRKTCGRRLSDLVWLDEAGACADR